MKKWYESKTIWTNLVAGLAGLFAVFGLDLPPKEQAEVVATLLGVVNVGNIFLRTITSKGIER